MGPVRVLSLLLAVLAAGPAAAAPPVPSRPISGWDGGTLGSGETAAFAALGWPALEAGFRWGVADSLDLGLEGTWQFPRAWLEADATVRYLLYGRRGVAFSAVGRVGAFRNNGRDSSDGINRYDQGIVVGLGLGAGFRIGEELITTGVDAPLAIGLDEGTSHLPLLLSLGLDHPLEAAGAPASIGVGFEAGPWGAGGAGDSFFYWAFVVRGTHRL